MEKIDLGIFSEHELTGLILDNTLHTRAFLEKVIFPNSLMNINTDEKKFINDMLKENLEHLTSGAPMAQKILQSVIYNQALMRKIAELYIADLCAKYPGKNIDEIAKKFFSEVESSFYDLVAKIMAAKKEPPEPGNTNIGSSNNE